MWDAEYTTLYDEYAPIIGKATCQQIARKNSEAWRSHFWLPDQYYDDSNLAVTEKPSPPGYWGTREEGYELHGLVRNDLYTFDWDEDTTTLEFGVGDVLAVERPQLDTRRFWRTVVFTRPTQPQQTRKSTAGVIDWLDYPRRNPRRRGGEEVNRSNPDCHAAG